MCYLKKYHRAYDRKDKEDFRKQTQQFLDLILAQDRLLSTRKEFFRFLLVECSSFSGNYRRRKAIVRMECFRINHSLGDSIAANQGDYMIIRIGNGVDFLKDLYYQCWKAFFEQKQAELDGKPCRTGNKLLWDGESLGREE